MVPKCQTGWQLGLLNSEGIPIDQSPVSAKHLGQMVQMIDDDRISGKIAKTVFSEMVASGQPPEEIVKNKGLAQVSDPRLPTIKMEKPKFSAILLAR